MLSLPCRSTANKKLLIISEVVLRLVNAFILLEGSQHSTYSWLEAEGHRFREFLRMSGTGFQRGAEIN